MSVLQTGARVIPGVSQAIETVEREFVWGSWDINRTWVMGCQIAPDSVDTGADPTYRLRPGLSMGYDNTTNQANTWAYSATGANLFGFLLYAETTAGPMRGQSPTEAGHWFGYVLVGGQIRTKDVIFNGALDTAAPTYTYGNLIDSDDEAAIRAAIAGRFWLDDFTSEFA